MMEDYISRKEAIERFMFEHGDYIQETNLDGSPVTVCVKDIKSILRSISSSDVSPVVHAKWEYHGGDDDMNLYGFCSSCHNSYEEDLTDKFNYCPHCGARMDG